MQADQALQCEETEISFYFRPAIVAKVLELSPGLYTDLQYTSLLWIMDKHWTHTRHSCFEEVQSNTLMNN